MSLKISRILHAGYIFTKDQTNIVFDPIFENPFSVNCYAFPSVIFDLEAIKKIRFDAVFISHYHDDHFSMESLNLIERNTPIYIYCIDEEILSIIRCLGFKNVFQLEINQVVTIDSFRVTPRQALDADVDSLLQIQVDSLNILNVVDSWIDDYTIKKLESLKPWNLILWPFQMMRELEVIAADRFEKTEVHLPHEWLEQLRVLNPENLVPSSCQFKMESWSWYNQAYFPISYKKFGIEMSLVLPETKIIKLDPSESIQWRDQKFYLTEPIPWIQVTSDKNEDYQYDPNLEPPPTQNISKLFSSLTDDQKNLVIHFCENEISERFNSLPIVADPYFHNLHIWQLKLWDENANDTVFLYQIRDARLSRIQTATQPVSWTTELPIQKLYSAIVNGESLTSLYVRIYGSQFDDLVDDPLIRSLYTGQVASYQKAQLRKLNKI